MGRFTLRDLRQPISLRAARDYLAQHGWRIREDGQRLVCEGPADDESRPIVQFLPADESYSDYPLRLEDLISALSVLEERPAVEIAAEMARYDESPPSPAGLLAEELIAELGRSGIQLAPGKDLQQVVNELRPLMASTELAIQQGPLHDLATRQQAALLAVRFVRLVAVNRASQMLLWWLCDRLLSAGGFRLSLLPEQVEELCRVASLDDALAPDEVLDWITRHARKVRSKKVEMKGPVAGAKRPDPPADSGGPVH
ncbi:MAG TPA: hypothetical protein VHS06_12185 [Chloroflexota bacterium]|nr:hypothetical protein [Chloroflexota bacterium]